MELEDGMAKFLPAGSKLVFQLHYTPHGTPQEDRSCVGLIFADPKTVRKQVVTQRASNRRCTIPPGAKNYRVEATYTFANDSLMLSLFPHMHLRGKSFRYTAQYPDGRSEILLDIPRYDFNWQNGYQFAEPKLMPAGTKLHCVAHYDNSKQNLANPDPTACARNRTDRLHIDEPRRALFATSDRSRLAVQVRRVRQGSLPSPALRCRSGIPPCRHRRRSVHAATTRSTRLRGRSGGS